MKKYLFLALLVLLVGTLTFGGCSQPTSAPAPATTTPTSAPASSEVIQLTLNLPIPPIHTRWVKAIKPWCDEIASRSNGKVEIVPYFAEALSKMEDNYDSVVAGTADMGECAMQVPAGRYPLLQNINICGTPSLVVKDMAMLTWELYKSTPAIQDEMSETHVLFIHASTPAGFATSKKPLPDLKSFEGLKLNMLGPKFLSDKCATLGVIPNQITMADFYMAVERGVLDGGTANYELEVARKWGDVLKHHCPFAPFDGNAFYMVMNLDVWNSLPADVQEVFNEVGGDYAAKMFSDYWWKSEMDSKVEYEQNMGGTTYLLPDADLAKIDELTKPVVEAFVNDMDSKGFPFSEVYSNYLVQEKKYGVPANVAYK